MACPPDTCGDCESLDPYTQQCEYYCWGCCTCYYGSCEDDQWLCDTCGCCSYCDCEYVWADSISGISGPYAVGDSTSVDASVTGSLPPDCSISWSGDASFSNESGTSATATSTTVGTGLQIEAATNAQTRAVPSSEFTVKECFDDNDCDPNLCQICTAGGTCIDRCPISHEYCDGSGECVECLQDSHCPPAEYYGCRCAAHECDDCWAYATVPANDALPCPECDDDEGGCYSTHIRKPNEYAVYTGILNPPAPEEMGVCGYHTKSEPVRFLTTCVEYQTDALAAAEFVYSIYNVYSGVKDIASCAACYAAPPASCLACFEGLIESAIWDLIVDKCTFVEGCNRCPWDDESCSDPLTTGNVVDWGAGGPMCFLVE